MTLVGQSTGFFGRMITGETLEQRERELLVEHIEHLDSAANNVPTMNIAARALPVRAATAAN